MSARPILTVSGVRKDYGSTAALAPTSLELVPGELAVLTGPSGSGKSTLLMIAGGWETPDEGEVIPHPPLADVAMAEQPWEHVGVVPQSISLLEELSIADNLAFAARRRGSTGGADLAALLAALDLDVLAGRLPGETSRGEQQRAAVGRALAAGASLVLADEPTSHQDRRRGELVLDVLRAAADGGACVLIASHDPVAIGRADREISLG
ncbi:ATP-binding cassette domain-containing protein [Prauserella cavernicola]|uniref:ABC transporter ATP-binding protein n=1 Tax=Prauserella cavernicola TaxID=2800127 RepID=A0A934V3C3_9PSEU|nr:ATP-binding cassette domain-containing protein [Prauserella cavernicola]MBK1782830.1 ABC transporter ATP-binding protein [Prauserella cavernicola]